eukprot:m.133073 g.133073  ORF g.133073 m.133073 type:complete len:514 (+) comp38100_c0_seq1:50-1591(+)
MSVNGENAPPSDIITSIQINEEKSQKKGRQSSVQFSGLSVVEDENRRTSRSGSRRRSSLKIIFEPTKAIDTGWSWVVVAASFILTFVLIGVTSSFGVIYVPLLTLYSGQNESSNSTGGCSSNETSSISGQTAWIGNTATLLTFSLGPFAAALANRWGVRPIVLTGAILFTLGILLTSLTNKMWQAFLTYGILTGTGGALIYSPGVGIIPAYFDKRKTLAISLGQTGSYIGVMVISSVMKTIENKRDWRHALYFAGGISSVMIVMALLYRPRFIPLTLKSTKKQSLKKVIIAAWKTQRHPRFALWVWLIGFHFLSLYMFLFHIYRHAECNLHISPADSALLLTYPSAVGTVFSVLCGYVGDHLEYRIPLLQAIIFVGGIANVFFPLYKTYSHLVGYTILFGINYSFLAVMSIIPSDLVGLDDAVNAFGVLSFTSSLFGAFGGPLAGWIFDATGSYDVAFIIAGGISISASILMSLDIWLKKREKQKKQLSNVEQIQQQKAVEHPGSIVTYETAL